MLTAVNKAILLWLTVYVVTLGVPQNIITTYSLFYIYQLIYHSIIYS